MGLGAALQDGDPSSVGPYEVISRLGEGGSGVVFEAAAADGARVAVKVLHRDLAASAELRERLAREAAALQRVRGDRIARVLSVEVEDDTPHIVMELVEGETLAAIVEREPLQGPMLAALAEGLVEALADIHAAGIVHRDLKPSNIIFGRSGAKVVDFGVSAFEELASSTRTGVLMGTPAWLAPEQATGQDVGPAADIHNVGMVLAFAATGVHPYGQGRADAMLFRIVHQEPQLEGVPSGLLETVRACLSKDPSARPTLGELAIRLTGSDTVSGRQVGATRLGAALGGRQRKQRSRRSRFALAGAALIVAVLGVGSVALGRLDATGPLVLTYSDETARNPQLGEVVIELTSPGVAPLQLRVDPGDEERLLERVGEWRLSSPLTIQYRPSSRQSDAYLESIDLRGLGMNVLSRGRPVRIALTVTDAGSAIDVSPARVLGRGGGDPDEVLLARADEQEVRRLEEEAERARLAEEARQQAERERRVAAERERQERELEAARQERIAQARALRESCTSSTRALWDAQFSMVYYIDSGYRSARNSLIGGRSVTPYGYQMAIYTLDGIMVDNHNVGRSTLSGTTGGSNINPAVTRMFNASSSLIDAWRALSRALSVPRDWPGGSYSDILPREHSAIDSADRELSAATAALREAVRRDAAADCARQYPDP
jgi:hypothetical protein